MRKLMVYGAVIGLLSCAGCATVGHDFPVVQVPQIVMNKTTKADIREMFGSPWRVGVEDGIETWTYGRYKYRLFGESSTTDIVIRFNDRGVVTSYTFNTTEHRE